jgi:hypothetical protein
MKPNHRTRSYPSWPSWIAREIAMAKKPLVEFKSRPRVERIGLGFRRIFMSKCGRYRIVESRLRGLSPVVYLTEADAWGWRIVSRHRTRGGAEKACQRHAAAIASPAKATGNHG